jgi:outer membrane protein insertion porin family
MKLYTHTALFILCSSLIMQPVGCVSDAYAEKSATDASQLSQLPLIKNVVVEGNKYIKQEAILKRLPFKVGIPFDEGKSNLAIKNIYDLGSFRQVRIEIEEHSANEVTVFVVVEEKYLVESFDFIGNKSIKTKEIKEKLNLDKVASIDEETLDRVARAIERLYREENRHQARVTFRFEKMLNNPDKVKAVFTIDEGKKLLIKRVFFRGNSAFADRKLTQFVNTRENWLLSFMDSAGTYNEEMLEMDKHNIEYFYRDHGYLMVKVAKVDVDINQETGDINVTFHINEGKQFKVSKINVVGDDLYDNDELERLVLLEEGKPYSQSLFNKSSNRIKDLYGEKGYIYADVYPQIKPDEETLTVEVSFHVERGNKLYANRITISGNKITRDKVIRRQLDLAEGDLITTKALSKSQSGVEFLSYFERDGVKWKIHRLSDNIADLEMNVQEAKTGNMNVMMTYGTDQYNPTPSLRGMLSVEKNNIGGLGLDGGLVTQVSFKGLTNVMFRKFEAHIFDPHIFDSNVSCAVFGYHRRDEFDQWKSTQTTPDQKVTGGNVRFGWWLPEAIDKRMQLGIDIGIENIKNNKPQAKAEYLALQPIINRTFQEGTIKWIGLDLTKDTRDHQIYPSSGYRSIVSTRLAPLGINKDFSFFKAEVEGSYYTALIGQDSLVLCLHAKAGSIYALTNDQPIPYKELYHMGGQTTVRGFVWGGIGPAWAPTGDPLGARNAIQFNSELIFPLLPDYSMKAHFFYDAGAGWDTPRQDIADTRKIRRNHFDLRNSVGFGLNMVKPTPVKIDWGFKLDRKKDESPHEFHLSMNYAW